MNLGSNVENEEAQVRIEMLKWGARAFRTDGPRLPPAPRTMAV